MTKGCYPDKETRELICIALDCTMEELEGKEMVNRETELRRNASAVNDPTAAVALARIQSEEIKRGEVWEYFYNTKSKEIKRALVLRADEGYVGIVLVGDIAMGGSAVKVHEGQWAVCDRITFAQRDRFVKCAYKVEDAAMQCVNEEIAVAYCGKPSILEFYREMEDLRDIIRAREDDINKQNAEIGHLKARNAELIRATSSKPEEDVVRLMIERDFYKEQYGHMFKMLMEK